MSARRATGISYAQGPIWLSSLGSTGVVALDVEQEEGRPPAAAPLEREPVIRGGLERRAPLGDARPAHLCGEAAVRDGEAPHVTVGAAAHLAAAQQLICPRDEERGRVSCWRRARPAPSRRSARALDPRRRR